MSNDATGSPYEVTIDVGPNCEWVVQMLWREGNIAGGPAEMYIRPSGGNDDGTISSTVLREIDFAYARERVRAQVEASEKHSKSRERIDERSAERLRAAMAAGVTTDDYRALLSHRFTVMNLRGTPDPTGALADELGKTRETIRVHLWQARRNGWLNKKPGPVADLPQKTRDALDVLLPGTAKRIGQ